MSNPVRKKGHGCRFRPTRTIPQSSSSSSLPHLPCRPFLGLVQPREDVTRRSCVQLRGPNRLLLESHAHPASRFRYSAVEAAPTYTRRRADLDHRGSPAPPSPRRHRDAGPTERTCGSNRAHRIPLPTTRGIQWCSPPPFRRTRVADFEATFAPIYSALALLPLETLRLNFWPHHHS